MAFTVCNTKKVECWASKRFVERVEPAVLQVLTEQEVLTDAQVVDVYYALDGAPGSRVCWENDTPVIVVLSNGTHRRLLITLDMYGERLKTENIFDNIRLFPLKGTPIVDMKGNRLDGEDNPIPEDLDDTIDLSFVFARMETWIMKYMD